MDGERRKGMMRAVIFGRTAIRAAILVFCLCGMYAATAWADVIWTPEDSFYEKNYNACDYVGRRYYANGPKGYVSVVKEPGSRNVLDYISNGEIFYVSMSYGRGITDTWGLVQYKMDGDGRPVEDYSWDDDAATVGWIDMDSLVAVYDGLSFAEEHQAGIKKTGEEDMPQVSIPDNGVIYLWEYPGSGEWYGKVDSLEGKMEFDKTYEDEDGNLWGHSAYYYGYKDFWVNISNPGEEHPKAMGIQPPKLVPAMNRSDLAGLPRTGQDEIPLPAVVGGMIVLVIVVTGAVIYSMSVKQGSKDH